MLPAGLLFASVPAHASAMLAWSFLCGWLAAVWRPLAAGRVSPGILWAASVYVGCLAASWFGQTLTEAAGVAPAALGGFIVRGLPTDHLVFSSPEPQTWAFLHAVTGIGLLLSALSLTPSEPRLPRWIAAALVTTMATLALVTVVQLLREWAGNDYGSWFLLRYLQGHRFSAHMADLNAAGSQYVLAGLIAVAWVAAGRHRVRWNAAIVLMLPAFWLSGSRSAAFGAIAVGAAVLVLSRRSQADTGRAPITFDRIPLWLKAGVSAAVAVAVALAAASAALETGEHGGASDSLRLRSLFLQTSGRMLASAPVLGVGVGQYLPRSAEFMPAELHAIYPFENAHNYVAQEFAELGIVGGLAFLALVAVGLSAGWRAVNDPRTHTAVTALFAASAGYLLTCVTGHPLLVLEAALPFWVVFGIAAGHAPDSGRLPSWARVAATLAGTLLVGSVVMSGAQYSRMPKAPMDRGFHDQRVSDDGVTYRWSTRHAVAWVPPDIGFLTIPIRGPELANRTRPFRAQVEIDGRVVKTVTASPDEWTPIGISLKNQAPQARRRVDVRVSQVWTPMRDRGDNEDDRPMGVMVGTLTLQTLPAAPTLP